ncbi:hypothetical protein [Streptomyces sp. NPDC088358]|uniref:hypothetical protein n=1 Tax=Streptomyces sp. NPDC088358 TaxID=3365857 RepID=UPI003813588C
MQKWLAGRDVIVAVGTEPAGSDLRSPPTAHGGPPVRAGPDPDTGRTPDRTNSGPPTDGAPVDEPARALAEVPRTPGPTLIAVPEEYP